MLQKILRFKVNGDLRGNLAVVEGNRDIPFDIKRIFYIYGVRGDMIRGRHANKKSAFVFICLAGKCTVKIDDGKGGVEEYELSSPDTGLYVPQMYWKEMYDFSEDAVLLVLSNEHYDSEEYIRSYDVFTQIVQKDEAIRS